MSIKMEKIGPTLARVIEDLGLQRRVKEYRVVAEWEEIVGEVIARRAEPITVERGRLVVRVKSSPWLFQMRMCERDILEKIGLRLGEGVIGEIRFIGS